MIHSVEETAIRKRIILAENIQCRRRRRSALFIMIPHASIRVSSLQLWISFSVALTLTLCVANGVSVLNSRSPDSHFRKKNAVCPCSDTSLCLPVNITREKEIMAFSLDANQTAGPNWHHYDWDHITTIIYFHGKNRPLDSQLVCYAHSKGVRVVIAAVFSMATLTNETLRDKWVVTQVDFAVENFLDGINVDMELTLTKEQAPLLTNLMQLLTDAFHTAIPSSKVSLDAPSTRFSRSRPYEYGKLAAMMDYMVIMAYDMGYAHGIPSNVASSHGAYTTMVQGIGSYFDEGIPASKLVLAVPWYGYDFQCTNLTGNICSLEYADCFDCDPPVRASSQLGYLAIMNLVAHNATTKPMWNGTCDSYFFSYKDQSTGQMHQVWYDNSASLVLRYYFAKVVNLFGVSMWHADLLDYSNNTVARQQTKAMWDSIAKFLEPL